MSGRAEALRLETPAASALPDPVVGIGLANVPIDSFSLDSEAMTQKQVFVGQKIPWLSSLSLQEQLATLKALEARTRVVTLQLGLESQLAKAWYDLDFLNRSLSVNLQLQAIVNKSLRIAESRYATGTGSQQDILMAQVKLTEFLQEQSRLIAQEGSLRARIGGLLNRPEPFRESIASVAAGLPEPPELPELIAQAMQNNPELQSRQLGLQQAKTAVSLADNGYMPDFDLRLSYGQREDNPDTGDERADFLSASVSFTVPLYQTRKQDSRLAAARMRQKAAERAISAFRSTLTNDVHRLVSELAGIRSGFELLQKPLLIQVNNLEEASLAAYSTGKLSFDAMLQAQVRVLQANLALDRMRTEYSKKTVELCELAGLLFSGPEVRQ